MRRHPAPRPHQILEDGRERAHVPYAYGFAIILLTVMVKAATYPLSRKSVSARALGGLPWYCARVAHDGTSNGLPWT